MSKQPETLRLAEALEGIPDLLEACNKNAAAELRRLHEVNQELVEALTVLLKLHDNKVDIAEAWETSMEEARAALRKARGER